MKNKIGQVEAEGPVAPDGEVCHIADRLQRAVVVKALPEGIPAESFGEVGG